MAFFRRSSLYLLFISAVAVLFISFALFHAISTRTFHSERMSRSAELVKRLDLTDLCLFTEASYTRHPSQADIHSAFKDHPLSLDHFPSGSFVKPSRSIR